jgi:transposase
MARWSQGQGCARQGGSGCAGAAGGSLPTILINTLREQWNGPVELDKQNAHIERRLQTWMKEDKACETSAAIPGVDLLTATAEVATVGDAKTLQSGREFDVDRTGAGIDRIRWQGPLAGDQQAWRHIFAHVVHGARSVLFRANEPGSMD